MATPGAKIWIPHSRPTLGEVEAEAAAAVVRSAMVAQGAEVQRFEQALAKRCKLARAAAVSSGTAGLYLALKALGIGGRSEVVIPGYVCSAVLNAVRQVGAKPVLADVDPASGNLDADAVRRCLTQRTGAVIVVHLFGRPSPVAEIAAFGVPVIEDCAQAIGATIDGRPVGGFGTLAVFSFYATKVITTGEGGAVGSNQTQLIEKIAGIRDYDNRFDPGERFNFKMNDIQAAIGCCQLDRLDRFIQTRRSLARAYGQRLHQWSSKLPQDVDGQIHYRYVLDGGKTVRPLIEALRRKGIEAARPIFSPLDRMIGADLLRGVQAAWQHHLSLPIYPTLTMQQVAIVADAIDRLFARA